MKKRDLILLVSIPLIVVGLFLMFNPGKSNLAPPQDLTGNIIYDTEPLTLEQLEAGVELNRDWNVFIWNDKVGYIFVDHALDSLKDSYLYIFEYESQDYYFNPNGKFAKNNFGLYEIIKELKPGRKYAIYMMKEDELKYEVKEIGIAPKASEELKEEKPSLDWIWVLIVFVIVFIIFKNQILRFVRKVK